MANSTARSTTRLDVLDRRAAGLDTARRLLRRTTAAIQSAADEGAER
ncbi:hypothetical protein ABZ858_14305 [Streptomyces sp. NPDC047017]